MGEIARESVCQGEIEGAEFRGLHQTPNRQRSHVALEMNLKRIVHLCRDGAGGRQSHRLREKGRIGTRENVYLAPTLAERQKAV